jgi:protein-L-isoaspartate(D-aspartate) O-methyltransferase
MTPEDQMQFLYTLRKRGVTDVDVLTAMERTDRAFFVTGVFAERVYQDMPLPIGCGQTISQPSVVGMMTQALGVTKKCKVLEVGTGSGYQAAVLAQLARRVYTVDRHRDLVITAKAKFEALDLGNVIAMRADGSRGLPDQAPFDRIMLTAAAEDPPAPLLAQLRVGGIMVLPVGQTDAVQTLIRVEKTEDGLNYEELGDVRFVPLVEGIADK